MEEGKEEAARATATEELLREIAATLSRIQADVSGVLSLFQKHASSFEDVRQFSLESETSAPKPPTT